MNRINSENREWKDLSVEEITKGYVYIKNKKEYNCVFCGKTFEEGTIYQVGSRFITAEKAISEHMWRFHGSVFESLLNMDKQINGLTNVQKNILQCFFDKKDTETIGEELSISQATVRTHKHNIQRMKREAKILLALMNLLESEERPINQNNSDTPLSFDYSENITSSFTGNSLHPFFFQKHFD